MIKAEDHDFRWKINSVSTKIILQGQSPQTKSQNAYSFLQWDFARAKRQIQNISKFSNQK